MMIIAFSQLFVWILVLEGIPAQIAELVVGMDLGPVAVLLLISVFVLLLGTFIDVSPAISAAYTNTVARGAGGRRKCRYPVWRCLDLWAGDWGLYATSR